MLKAIILQLSNETMISQENACSMGWGCEDYYCS